MKRLFPSSIILMMLGVGCAVGPDYKRPEVKMPDQHRGVLTAADKNSLADLPWWEVFKDPILKGLVEEALKNNLDLKTATARVEQVRELARIKKGDYYPQLNYSAADNYGRNVPSYGLPGGKESNMMLGTVDLQWELDLWGRVRRASESAREQYLASMEARRGVALILVTEVARTYFELRELDKELEIAKMTRDSYQETYNMFTQRYKAGTASLLESSRAGAYLAQTEAAIPELEGMIFQKENEINLLLGRGPASIPRGQTLNEQYLIPQTPVGLPSALLERRPDIREAEHALMSANADIGVAKANFFPKFSLTGLLGAASSDLKTFSSSWSLGGSMTGPLFNGGKISANYQATKYAYEQAKAQYEKKVMTALKEVADIITTQQKLVVMREKKAKAVDFLTQSTKLATFRYVKGLANYDDVLDAEEQLFPAQLDLARTDRDRLLAVVLLFRALGGGWNAGQTQQ